MAGTALTLGLTLLAAVVAAGAFAVAALAGLSHLADRQPRSGRRCGTAPVIIARVRARDFDRAPDGGLSR